MIDKISDATLIEFEQKYQELHKRNSEIISEISGIVSEIEDLQNEIEALESEQSDIEDSMEKIKERIAQIKNNRLTKNIWDLNIETDDAFIQDFIKASYFTEKTNERPVLNTVNITDYEMQAADGYRGIIIKNNDIPKELQSHKFNWDIRENFKNNISDKDEEKFIDLQSIMPKENDARYAAFNINPENFYETFKITKYDEKVVLLHYKGLEIACRKEYIDDSLFVLMGETFSVYFYNDKSPIFLKTDRLQIMLLPIRINH